jgi:hypothetical protein
LKYKNKQIVTKSQIKMDFWSFLTVFIVTTFKESQNCHKWSHLRPSQCDKFCNIKAGSKTRPLKLSKTSRIATAYSRHNTESQCSTWASTYNIFSMLFCCLLLLFLWVFMKNIWPSMGHPKVYPKHLRKQKNNKRFYEYLQLF